VVAIDQGKYVIDHSSLTIGRPAPIDVSNVRFVREARIWKLGALAWPQLSAARLFIRQALGERAA
jgi:hypothetical protein